MSVNVPEHAALPTRFKANASGVSSNRDSDRAEKGSREPETGDRAGQGSGEFRDLRLLPENGDVLRREAMVNIWHNRGKAITSLGLDSERKTKLLNLLVDQYEAQQDAFDVVRKSGQTSDAAISNAMSSVNQAAEKDLADFLGQSLYDRFQAATQTEQRETGVAFFLGPQMEMADAPLSPDQLPAMAVIETADSAAVSPGNIGKGGLNAPDSDKLAKAAKVLTP